MSEPTLPPAPPAPPSPQGLPSFAPRWLDLPNGVRVLHKPLLTPENEAARRYARRVVEEQQVEDPDKREGLIFGLYVQGIARFCIQEWTGVAAELTPDNAAHLMLIPGFAEAYSAKALQPLETLAAEGNGCGAALNGTGAAVPDTATVAAQLG